MPPTRPALIGPPTGHFGPLGSVPWSRPEPPGAGSWPSTPVPSPHRCQPANHAPQASHRLGQTRQIRGSGPGRAVSTATGRQCGQHDLRQAMPAHAVATLSAPPAGRSICPPPPKSRPQTSPRSSRLPDRSGAALAARRVAIAHPRGAATPLPAQAQTPILGQPTMPRARRAPIGLAMRVNSGESAESVAGS